MINQVILHGRLTEVPELRMTKSNTKVVSITIAVDRDTKEKATDFFNCIAFEQTAELINNYFTRGQEILINGRLQQEKYADKDGKNHSRTIVIANRVDFCGPKNAARDKAGNERVPQQETFYDLDDEGTLPF